MMGGIGLRLSAAFALSVIIGMVLVGVIALLNSQGIVEETQHRTLAKLQESFAAKLHSAAERALGLAELIAHDQKASATFAEGAAAAPGSPARQNARQRLQDQLLAAFPPMKAKHSIAQYQFHLPPATSFLRLHKPKKFGDDLSGFRHTVLAVNRTRQPVSGIEVGVAGLGLRGVAPVSYKGQHIGSIEFGLKIGQQFIETYAQESGADIAFYYQHDGAFKTEGSTFPQGFSLPDATLTEAMRSRLTLPDIAVGERSYAMVLAPVTDFSGQAIGVMVLGADRTPMLDSIAGVRNRVILIGLAVVALTVLASLLVTRHLLSRPLQAVLGTVERVARGDLTTQTDAGGRKDELGQLLNAIGRMIANLRRMLGAVHAVSDTVAAGSLELRNAAQQVADGAHNQATSVEQTSAAMEEMAATIRQNAQNATETETVSNHVADDAKKCTRAMAQTAGAMKGIADKIGVVDEITRKIDLLALNASVEAARAGEHGKGFAVVAAEVSKLADMSKQAAAEILQASEEGKEIAENTNVLLAELLPEIERSRSLVQGISAASEEQNAGAIEINGAIQELDRVVQQNAAAAEEMTTTAETLSQQGEDLRGAIGFFKLGSASERPGNTRPGNSREQGPPDERWQGF